MPAYFGVTNNRADDAFAFTAAPMLIPLDVDTPASVAPPSLILSGSVGLDSATVSTTVAGVLVTTAEEVLRMDFFLFIPDIRAIHGRFRIRVPWEVTVAGNAGSVGRIVVDMMRRRDGATGSLVAGGAYSGRLRPLDVVAAYNENELVVQVPRSNGKFIEFDDLVLRVSLFVTTAQAGASAATVVIHHDPGTAAKRLICETDWDLT